MKTRHIGLCPLIGIGYWKDVYDLPGLKGISHNLIIPFVRFQWGYLEN